ncbi:hypothetical protein P9222_00830 [Paenibacillus amylolyticus]|nr:hypothetical protein [Paenibacillus amylolyticus]WFR63027.1 hypothetical protein P9222_00830 [Paenibacillus amylolyticus]
MTYLEIKTAISAYVANKHVDLQHQALLSWHQAQLIGQLVSRVLGNKRRHLNCMRHSLVSSLKKHRRSKSNKIGRS